MSANTYINDGICYGTQDRLAFLVRREGLLQDRYPVGDAEPSHSSGGQGLFSCSREAAMPSGSRSAWN